MYTYSSTLSQGICNNQSIVEQVTKKDQNILILLLP